MSSQADNYGYAFAQDVPDTNRVHISFHHQVSDGRTLNMQISQEDARSLYECLGRCLERINERLVS